MFLGIDIGTSAVKTVLVNHRQGLVAEASIPLDVSMPKPGWYEQSPDNWWKAVRKACLAVRGKARPAYEEIDAIGLSGQMHGTVLLDDRDRPLRPSILWNDGRADAEARELNETLPDLATIAGVIAMPGFPAPKLLWLRRNERETIDMADCLLQAKDYVRLLLTGERATDMSDAAGSLLLDERSRTWSEEIVEKAGITPAHLPMLLEGNASVGVLRPSAADALKLRRTVLVAAGGGDAAAGAVGVGAVEEGRTFISVGTSGQYFVARKAYAPRRGRLIHSFAHCVPHRWFDMAALLNGASSFRWLAGILGMKVDEMMEIVPQSRAEPSDTLFLPYLAGERTPLNDPHLRGSLLGLGHETDVAALVQAAIDGVVLSFLDAAEGVRNAGKKRDPTGVIGGASESARLVQAFADAFNIEVRRFRGGSVGAAFGAARLARMAFTGESLDQVARVPPTKDTFKPDRTKARRYARQLEALRTAYGSLPR